MSEIINIIGLNSVSHKFSETKIGERTNTFIASQKKLNDDGKLVIISEAQSILKHCLAPGEKGNITNIAVGYIQSGKTLSYTTLSTLAADNGYRIIIYLTGVTSFLNNQTYGRIRGDLNVNETEWYSIFEDKTQNTNNDINEVNNYLRFSTEALLFPVLKHAAHIDRLTRVFSSPEIKEYLDNIGVLIIDDEADQASFNTYAKRNADKGDWEENEESSTYSSILRLRSVFPCLSYIQYTATPQAAFLINNNDILSPKYHTVLTPGQGYTGGKVFFVEKKDELIRQIKDVYDKENNCGYPDSLTHALQQFIISVAIAVYLDHDRNIQFLSMMVHPDGTIASNERFYQWVSEKKQTWLQTINLQDGEIAKESLINEFLESYNEITKYCLHKPSFEEIKKHLNSVLLKTKLHLVQSRVDSLDVTPESEIDWNAAPSHILVGANILNRGFTVENLSMTYMPRTIKGKATADTIEQRCRFFGYKRKYLDLCRVYLPKKSIEEYEAYVKHEEIMRAALNKCETMAEYAREISVLHMGDKLNPTRTNILSKKLIRGKMNGWREMGSIAYRDSNKVLFEQLLDVCQNGFVEMNPYMTNVMRKHRYAKVSIESFIEFLKQVSYDDLPNVTRKIVTIQYLEYLKSRKTDPIENVYVIQMSYGLEGVKLRERQLYESNKVALMMGRNPKGDLPADNEFKFEDSLCFQIHHFTLNNTGWDSHKDYYSFSVYYPEPLSSSFVSIEQEPYEDDEDEK